MRVYAVMGIENALGHLRIFVLALRGGPNSWNTESCMLSCNVYDLENLLHEQSDLRNGREGEDHMKRISQRRLALRLILSAIENCHFWLEDRDEETVGAYFDLIWLVMEPFDTGSAVDAHLNSINDCDSMYQHIQLLREAAEHLDSITDDEFHYEGSADYNRLLRVVSDHTPLGGGYWEPVKSTADQPSHRTTTDEPRYR